MTIDEDPEIPDVQDEAEDSEGSSPISPSSAVAILVAVVLFITVAIYFGVAQTVAGLFIVVGIPVVLLWFVWNLFLRRLWRIRRIRGAQERRELLEAALRDRRNKP